MWTEKIYNRVVLLDPWKQVAFMVICCERMVPNFYAFNQQSGFGSPEVLRNALSSAWEWIERDEVFDLGSLRENVEQQAPDTETYSSSFTSAALDAANSVATVLDAIERFNPSHVRAVIELARDTVDMWVQEKEDMDANDPQLEEKILLHPLMQKEMDEMEQSLKRLNVREPRRYLAEGLRATYESHGAGSIS